ncbi:hypothetical protein ACLKA7_000372 [Drosophila subpalustris]
MKLGINLTNPRSLIILIALLHLKCGNARTLASTTKVLATNEYSTEAMKSSSANKQQQQQNATTVDSAKSQRINDTTLPIQTQSTGKSQPESSTVVTHIVRKKRETEVDMPYDFHTMHMPCDLDAPNRAHIIFYFPNHCIWVANNRYAHEGFFRVYKLYQLEAHFFGQYYERLKRYEIDPHFFEYS